MIQKFLLNTYLIWIIFIKILKNTIQKNRKILIVFGDVIADMLSNKKLNPIATESFIIRIKLNISLVFITQSYFAFLENNRLSVLLRKIPNKIGFQ